LKTIGTKFLYNAIYIGIRLVHHLQRQNIHFFDERMSGTIGE
jgi:hypothetical protein